MLRPLDVKVVDSMKKLDLKCVALLFGLCSVEAIIAAIWSHLVMQGAAASFVFMFSIFAYFPIIAVVNSIIIRKLTDSLILPYVVYLIYFGGYSIQLILPFVNLASDIGYGAIVFGFPLYAILITILVYSVIMLILRRKSKHQQATLDKQCDKTQQ